MVRTSRQLDRVIAEIEAVARHRALHARRARRWPDRLEDAAADSARRRVGAASRCMDLFQSYLGAQARAPARRPACARRRIFPPHRRAELHACCMMTASSPTALDEADVVLVGVSRTSKTPTSIYLANRGIKTGQYPDRAGRPAAAPSSSSCKRPLIVGLIATPERIVQIRAEPLLGLNAQHDATAYVDRDGVADEIAESRRLFAATGLAGDRRDAPLDRGDGGGDHGAAQGASPRHDRGDLMTALTLASSPRRSSAPARLLRGAGLTFEAMPPAIDERARRGAAGRGRRARRRTMRAGARRGEGAATSRRRDPGALVIGADQTLALGGERCSTSRRRWTRRARQLAGAVAAGRTRCTPAVALARDGERAGTASSRRALTMRDVSTPRSSDDYLAAVGAAALGERRRLSARGAAACQLFETIEGDYFTILGLPLLPLLALRCADCGIASRADDDRRGLRHRPSRSRIRARR